MKYESTFHTLEPPSQSHVSCRAYTSDASNSFPKHCHTFYEMGCAIKGTRFATLNNNTYEIEEGSLILIPPLSIHSFKNKTDCADLLIQFDQLFLCNASVLFDKHYTLKSVDNCVVQSTGISKLILQIADLCRLRETLNASDSSTAADKLPIDMNINSLCIQMISMMLSEQHLRVDMGGAEYSDSTFLNSLIEAIMAHPENPPSMKTASRSVGMSYAHFSRFFEKATGFHYAEFCSLLRVRHAEDLLLSTSMPISEIASAIGISTVSYFTRLFCRVNGITPSAFRKKYTQR